MSRTSINEIRRRGLRCDVTPFGYWVSHSSPAQFASFPTAHPLCLTTTWLHKQRNTISPRNFNFRRDLFVSRWPDRNWVTYTSRPKCSFRRHVIPKLVDKKKLQNLAMTKLSLVSSLLMRPRGIIYRSSDNERFGLLFRWGHLNYALIEIQNLCSEKKFNLNRTLSQLFWLFWRTKMWRIWGGLPVLRISYIEIMRGRVGEHV